MLIVFWVRGAKIVKGESKAKIYFGTFFSLGSGKTRFHDAKAEERETV